MRVQDADFYNYSYPFRNSKKSPLLHSFGHFVTVKNGKAYVGKIGVSLSYSYFNVAEVLYGDLTGDGRDEAVVVTIFGSGSANFYKTNVYFYRVRDNKVELIAMLTEGRVEKEYERYFNGEGRYLFEAIENGRNVKDGLFSTRHFADGSHCCMENVAVFRYRLIGNRLKLVKLSKRRARESDVKMKAYYQHG